MKRMNSKKGFTLIELLIVIAIIAVLAVAFLPTILNAPAKGRDTARIAALQKIQKVIMSKTLEGKPVPDGAGAISTASSWKGIVTAGVAGTWASVVADFGGALPVEPTDGKFYYLVLTTLPAATPSYNYGLWAQVENIATGNANCTIASPYTITLVTAPTLPTAFVAGGTTYPCYAILTQ